MQCEHVLIVNMNIVPIYVLKMVLTVSSPHWACFPSSSNVNRIFCLEEDSGIGTRQSRPLVSECDYHIGDMLWFSHPSSHYVTECSSHSVTSYHFTCIMGHTVKLTKCIILRLVPLNLLVSDVTKKTTFITPGKLDFFKKKETIS